MFLLIDYVIGYVCSIFRYFIVYVTSGAPNLTTGRLLMTFQSGFLDVHGLIRWLLFGEFRDQLVGFQNDKQQKVPFFVLYDPALQQYYWMCSRVNSHMACACAFIWQLLDAGHCVQRNHSGGVHLTKQKRKGDDAERYVEKTMQMAPEQQTKAVTKTLWWDWSVATSTKKAMSELLPNFDPTWE